jgi:hypothetical protein
MGDTDVQIDFYAPAILRKWRSLNNERVSASLGILVVEGNLTMMYEAIRGALAADDAQKRQGSGNSIPRSRDPRLEGTRR